MWMLHAKARLSCKPGWAQTPAFDAYFPNELPCLRDTPTVALLLEQARFAHQKRLCSIHIHGRWLVCHFDGDTRVDVAEGSSEAEAVVAALEVADGQ
jgi:hypothetical protein